jgi:fucose permease
VTAILGANRAHGPKASEGRELVRTAPKTASAASRTFDLLSLGTFVVLGLPDGMLGTAWPAMRHSFGAPVGALGLILLINTIGSVVVAAFVGRLIQRIGTAAVLAVAGSCAALGGIGYAVAPGLWLVLSVGPLTGAASGLMDGGLNTAVALTGRPRLLNLLHGFYGVGTAIGPLVVTAAIVAGSWRPAYLVLAALDVTIAACWIAYRRDVPALAAKTPAAKTPAEGTEGAGAARDRPGGADGPAQAAQATAGWSDRRVVTVLTLGLIVFFLYTGLEVAAGSWEVSYARGHLGLSASAAGLAAFGYWGALTAVRIGLALPARPVPARIVIGSGLLLAIAATGLIWWQPGPVAVVLAFVVLGGALAGVFPALVAVTPQRIGAERAQHAIAWQVGAAAAGGSAISAVIGLLIDATSLAVLGPALVVLSLLLFFANAALTRLAPIREPAPPAPAAAR